MINAISEIREWTHFQLALKLPLTKFLQRRHLETCALGLRCRPQRIAFSPPLLCFSLLLPTSPHLTSPCWAPFFSVSVLLLSFSDLLSLHFPSRWKSYSCHPAVIMNSLVATPPVPPHFYENPRLSPSRISTSPSAGSLLY